LIDRLLQELSGYDVPLLVYKGKKKEEEEESTSSPSISRSSFGSGEGVIEVVVKKEVVGFEEEDIAGLERQEIIFGVFAKVIEKLGNIKVEDVEKVREAATKQIKSLPAFLKVGSLLSLAVLCKLCENFQHLIAKMIYKQSFWFSGPVILGLCSKQLKLILLDFQF
jgi:hypothetical protein